MKTALFASILSLLALLFQLFRIMAENLLALREFSFLRGLLLFRLHHNRGIAFSLFSSSPGYLSLAIFVSLCAAAGFFLLQRKKLHPQRFFFWGCLLLLAGGISNLGERLLFGVVTDYVGFPLPLYGYLFVNLADLALLTGAGMILLSTRKIR